MEQQTPTKPGPKKREGRTQCSVILDTDAMEWAKSQPNGLSGKLRELLNADYRKSIKKDGQSV